MRSLVGSVSDRCRECETPIGTDTAVIVSQAGRLLGGPLGSFLLVTLLRATREFEDDRNLIDRIENVWDPDGTPVTISSYDYANDAVGRRVSVVNEGDDVAFDADEYTRWGYNSRSELTESHRYLGDDPTKYATDTKVEAEYLDFNYDPIGNRTSHSVGSSIPVTSGYSTNA